MSIINEVIRNDRNDELSFGNYLSEKKLKVNDFEIAGNIYSVKTHNQITRLEKNGILLYESIPGSCAHGFTLTEQLVSFLAEGAGDTQITLQLETDKEYRIYVNDNDIGSERSNSSGKIVFSVELSDEPQSVKIEKL